MYEKRHQAPYSLGNTNGGMVGHGCSSHRILLEQERNYGLGMKALVTVFSSNTNEVWSGHGCSSHCILFTNANGL